MNPEKRRLEADRLGHENWRRWGPYLSERQWGTVREDYSGNGDAWGYFPYEMACGRAYRWGEDGLAGISDDQQHLCLAIGLWNGKDSMLKERLFGLANAEGNHGEDVKEAYYYLDAVPSHAYLKYLYKYPHGAFPYQKLRDVNRRRGKMEPEFELLDTGIFDDDRYFDVLVEYAKVAPDDVLMQVTVTNRGPEQAVLNLLLQLWFRNTWSWTKDAPRPAIEMDGKNVLAARHAVLGVYYLHLDGDPALLFCDNETDTRKLFQFDEGPGFFKDAFHEYIVRGNRAAVNPAGKGTKAAGVHVLTLPPGGSARIRARLADDMHDAPFASFDAVLPKRVAETDEFYAELSTGISDDDARRIHRQALAGMIWNKQYYGYDVIKWLSGDPVGPLPPAERRNGRNHRWIHFDAGDIISMPDKWEYPWFAAWDHGFHCVTLVLIDPEYAKEQLLKLLSVRYQHPNGQVPAYEWSFDEVNPPVLAWAAWRVFQMDREQHGGTANGYPGDILFLERAFHKLMLAFTWWVNRKDAQDRNIFQGGFLGLDNIGVFNRNIKLPDGTYLDQADGTSWVAMFSLNLMRIAVELAVHDRAFEDLASKFFIHFLSIAGAMTNLGDMGINLWDEEDQFFYDALSLPGDRIMPLKVRSMVGLIPLFAVKVLEPEKLERLPNFARTLQWFFEERPLTYDLVSHWNEPGRGERRLLSLLRGHRMTMILKRMLDESEFLSPYGVRSLSRCHESHPYIFQRDGFRSTVTYRPAESDSNMFGGNSNWRGPIWFPVNYLIIEALYEFHQYYTDDFKIECPTGSGQFLTIEGVAQELSRRLIRLFERDEHGRRPVFGDNAKLQTDPHFRDHLLFYEYFDGNNGRGVGASHQTGWTGLVARLLQQLHRGERHGDKSESKQK